MSHELNFQLKTKIRISPKLLITNSKNNHLLHRLAVGWAGHLVSDWAVSLV